VKSGEKQKESMPCAMRRDYYIIRFVASSSRVTVSNFNVGKIILDMVNHLEIMNL
jgi:hypothetical protein